MKILVGCEFSGIVTEAFRKKGHDSWSCDLLPSDGTKYHLQTDISEILILEPNWDMLIAFPPCTFLCSSGLHWNTKSVARKKLTEYASQFFLELANADVPRIAIENPIGCMSTRFRKPDQIIQPWQFGHPESKATCLWLKGLPLLEPTNILKPRGDNPRRGWDNQTPSGQNKYGPSPDRWKQRSVTYRGIAQAMADQWG